RHTRFSRDWSSDVCSSDLIFKEFKEFAMRGNVVDLAVGVVIGAAFGKIITSLVGDIITPVIGRITPGGADLKNKLISLEPDKTEIGRASCRERGENVVCDR